MIIGVPKEIKEHEYRVGITPDGVKAITKDSHRVIVEQSAGGGSAFSDEDYKKAGAEIADKTTLFKESDLIVKVKEPLPSEYGLFRENQALFTFLHLAANPDLITFLLKKNITGFAYETLKKDGRLPLLTPMSEVAGRMSPIMAAFYLQQVHGGRGILLTGVKGGIPAKVLILGAGIVGMNALRVSLGMGAEVSVINRGTEKLKNIHAQYGDRVRTLPSTRENIESEVVQADVVIGAVLVAGAKAPKLVSRKIVSKMKKGSVIVDVAVDQGGCVETTQPTTHANPVYTVDGVIHYAVTNMPGAFPRTSTFALTQQTLPYVKVLAGKGIERSIQDNEQIKSALNTYNGKITNKPLADSL
jgi:alanine dehydrogenase